MWECERGSWGGERERRWKRKKKKKKQIRKITEAKASTGSREKRREKKGQKIVLLWKNYFRIKSEDLLFNLIMFLFTFS